MANTYTVAGVQMDVAFAQPQQNLERFESALADCAQRGANLVVFPECALTGYCFESLDEARPYAETIPGPATERVAAACRRLGVYAIFGMLECDSERMFNALALVGPAGLVGSYRKIHLPFLGIDRFVTPGDRPFAVHEAGPARIGMSICYDGTFPESARVLALAGADLIVLPTNWPHGAECTANVVVNARALENAVFYMAVNRVGTERGFTFIGKSSLCDTNGFVLAAAQADEEATLLSEIDLDKARNKHIIRVPNKHEIDRFADRRPEMYGKIVEPI